MSIGRHQPRTSFTLYRCFHFSFSLLWQTLTSLSTQPVLHIDHLLAWTNISGSQSVRWGYLFKKRWLRSGAALFVWMFVLTLQEQGREAFTDAEPSWWWWWWWGGGRMMQPLAVSVHSALHHWALLHLTLRLYRSLLGFRLRIGHG